MNAEILYREIKEAGDDNEHTQYANGIVVVLSRWTSEDYKLTNHYVIEVRAMVDRVIVLSTHKYIPCGYSLWDDPKYIREAIDEFDHAVNMHPAYGNASGKGYE